LASLARAFIAALVLVQPGPSIAAPVFGAHTIDGTIGSLTINSESGRRYDNGDYLFF
jgi:hypothetical protein